MAVDMKVSIAEAVIRLLFEKNKKKITVKDIVEECHITRQAFYYHFADIPDLVKWMIGQKTEKLFEEMGKLGSIEEKIKYLILLFLNTKDHVKKGMESNYSNEIQEIVFDQFLKIFKQMADEEFSTTEVDSFEQELAIRYHCYAMMGMLANWDRSYTENIDRVVHDIHLLVIGGQQLCHKEN